MNHPSNPPQYFQPSSPPFFVLAAATVVPQIEQRYILENDRRNSMVETGKGRYIVNRIGTYHTWIFNLKINQSL
jgi:hypothetical protein